MQHTWKVQNYSTHDALNIDKLSPLNQPRKSRCAKPRTKDPPGARLESRHIRVDSLALEAFLRDYSTEFDDATSSDESNCTSSNDSITRPLTVQGEEDEAWDSPYTQTARDEWSRSRDRSRISSPALPGGKTTSFDLLALIPSSAIAPYLPQLDLTLELLDIYFLELPSGSLMFNQQTVIRRYRESTLPHQVLFAMLALASLYCQLSVNSTDKGQKASIMKSVHEQGRIWAEIAGQMALARSDTTALTTVRTCEQISLFWFAVGERDRANFHADVSYRLYQGLLESGSHGRKTVNWNRAVSLHDSFAEYRDMYQNNTRFQLLYPEFDSWMKQEGLLPAGAALGYKMHNVWNDHIPPERYSSTKYAVGTVGLWRQVNSYLRDLINGGEVADDTLYTLELKLRVFNNGLPNILKAENLTDFQLAGPAQDAMLCFAIVHCASLIGLHSSRVWNLTKFRRSSKANSDDSERTVMRMARLGGDLIHEHITNFSKRRKTPPMAGYCVFAIGAVHAHMNEFRDGPGWSEPWIHGVSCLLLLEHMRSYWPVLGKLCHDLRKRFSYSDPNMMTISTELLWQLAGYPEANPHPPTDQFTSGFFSIPYSNSFVHEMLGLSEDVLANSEKVSSNTATSQNTQRDTLAGSNQISTSTRNGQTHTNVRDSRWDGPMGMVGTHPPTFNFEANLLGIVQPVYRG